MIKKQTYIQYIGGGYVGNTLTLNKVYLALGENAEYYIVRDNFGREDIWKKAYFKVVK